MSLVNNNAKYVTIKKALYNLWIDQIEGDFIEFGVFTGSSFRHTIKTEKALTKDSNSKFYGLDSFEGFPESTHPFFKQFDYVGNLQKVKKIEKLDNENSFITAIENLERPLFQTDAEQPDAFVRAAGAPAGEAPAGSGGAQ